jgi:hypothetical protein
MLTSPSSSIVIFALQSFPMSVHDSTAVHASDTVTSANNVPVPGLTVSRIGLPFDSFVATGFMTADFRADGS